jgi:drug/metabolite transporter (DMT)-like permease
MPAVPGAWAPLGGVRTSRVAGWVALIATLVAIGCTLVPSSSDPHPVTAFLKIVFAAVAMLVIGMLLFALAKIRASRAAVVTGAST